ncbi:hypothetical protein NT01EI_2289 [Edwardsiella ictaluri 93-146]|uniref:Uncharacterized protein n=1 Tax=Edwardsiella ictaluri (strain 93-146) TaxID=634503 RepID=C5BH29_EDWI9|nr:hypothetical protein NT01EI_2289 [Edwardsiella ictaluri 93-146]
MLAALIGDRPFHTFNNQVRRFRPAHVTQQYMNQIMLIN